MELREVGDWDKEHGEGGMLVKGELEFQHTYLEQHHTEQWFLNAGSQTSLFSTTLWKLQKS